MGSGASGTIRLIGGGQDRLSVSLRGLPPRGAFYEVWLYRSVTDAVSLGRAGRSSRRLQVSLPARAADYPFIDVSLERPDGNRSHSGQSVLRARLR